MNLGVAEMAPPGLPPLTELFAPERFHYDIPGRSFAEVLRAALDVLKLPPEDKELIYDLLVSREKLMTTALGDGLAIPHLRVPVVVDVPRPALSIFFTCEPIDMGALDGMPVHTLFLLLCYRSRAQAASGTARALDISVPPTRVRQAAARAGETGNDPRMDFSS